MNADHIDREAQGSHCSSCLSIGVVSDAQLAGLKKFVEKGGGLLVTGETGMCDESGTGARGWPLAEILGLEAGST